MPFDPQAAIHLKPWLVRTLEPICDAEPGALADYILALLKHNVPEPEMRKELTSQLEEFLEKECAQFIDTLFTTLRTKSYLPYSTTPTPPPSSSSNPQQTNSAVPFPANTYHNPSDSNSPDRGRKRNFEHDERDGRPAKGPRLSQDGQFSRYGRNDARSTWGNRNDRGSRMEMTGRADYMDGGMNAGVGMDGTPQGPRGSYRPPERPRGICRDYHNTGYCARGIMCKYSHGDDAIIPNQFFPMNTAMQVGAMPFMGLIPQMNPAGPSSNTPYDPRERMDMRSMQIGGINRHQSSRAPILPRHGDVSGAISRKPGELPVIQDLTPEISPEEGSSLNAQTQPVAETEGSSQPSGSASMDVDTSEYPPPPMLPQNGRSSYRGEYRHAGTPGTFAGDTPNFRPERRKDKTLVVERIPEDKLSLGSVNEWFSKFGTVTNVAVDAANKKALVSFNDHEAAHAAWKAEDAVFGNRFVKVFWHRPMDGHGQKGARMLAASAPLVANISTPKQPPSSQHPAPSQSSSISTSSRKVPGASTTSALAAKQQLLEQQIAEQKSLMAKLGTASPQEKKDIMVRLRKLNEEMKLPATSEPKVTAPTTSAVPPSKSPAPQLDAKEQKERDRLDKELELHKTVSTTADGEQEESTEELQAKLERLKAEAASLGLSESGDTLHNGGGSYRPYRGRGRGSRGYWRGSSHIPAAARGGMRPSLKLDNRPKKLLVKGADQDKLQSVRGWYESTHQMDTIELTEDGDILVAFKSRAAAEMGLAKGSEIPDVGSVQISWYTPSVAKAASHKSPITTVESIPLPGDTSSSTNGDGASVEHQSLQLPEEEDPARGWGGADGEDDFGML